MFFSFTICIKRFQKIGTKKPQSGKSLFISIQLGILRGSTIKLKLYTMASCEGNGVSPAVLTSGFAVDGVHGWSTYPLAYPAQKEGFNKALLRETNGQNGFFSHTILNLLQVSDLFQTISDLVQIVSDLFQIVSHHCFSGFLKSSLYFSRGGLRNLFSSKSCISNNEAFLFVCLFVCLFVRSFVCLFVRLFVRLFVCSFVCSFVRLFVCSFVRSFVRLFVCAFVCLSVCLFVLFV